MALHNLLTDGKADTCALVLLMRMEPLEHVEYLLLIARLKPNAVIADKQFIVLIAYRKPTEFDAFAWRMIEFDRISDEMHKYLPKKGRLSVNGGPVIAHHNLDIRGQIKRCYHSLEKHPDVDCLTGPPSSADHREVQQIIKQFGTLVDRAVETVYIDLLVSFEGRFEFFAQKVAVVVDSS
jgi:hypothetical protein